MNTASLGTGQMQTIAREFNLSETTFVDGGHPRLSSRGRPGEDLHPQEELNFAGHPTLGTASVLKLQASETVQGDTLTLAENVGPVPVRFSGQGLFGEMTQRDPEFGAELDPAGSGAADRARIEDLDPAFRRRSFPPAQPLPSLFALRRGLARLSVNQQQATAVAARTGRALVLCAGPDRESTERRAAIGARACGSTVARIRRLALRPAAPSATW